MRRIDDCVSATMPTPQPSTAADAEKDGICRQHFFATILRLRGNSPLTRRKVLGNPPRCSLSLLAMMRVTVLRATLACVLGFSMVDCAAAQQRSLGNFGDWTAMMDATNPKKKLCYVGTTPKKAEGKYASRGDVHLLVTHRPAEKVRGEISITTGYDYREGKDVDIDIDGKAFKLFTRGDNAWARDASADRAIVAAMKAGRQMVVRGTSSRGTLTTDTYSLSGFSAALAAIDKACQ